MSAPKWLVMLALIVIVMLIVAMLCQIITRSSSTRYPAPSGYERFSENSTDLIYVYMENCSFCKQFNSTWDLFIKQYGDALKAAGVSAVKLRNDHKDASALGVTGFPTVLLISKTGEFAQQTLNGPRTVPGLAAFVSSSVPAFQA